MRIIIATGIYPPQVGGLATYSKKLEEAYSKMSDTSVKVITYGNFLQKLPVGVRHVLYALKFWVTLGFFKPNLIIALGTFSVATPVRWARALHPHKAKCYLRIGGDAAWESHCLRKPSECVSLKEFYHNSANISLNFKERVIQKLVKKELGGFDAVVFPNTWLESIYKTNYQKELAGIQTHIIENQFFKNISTSSEHNNQILFAGRDIPLKNLTRFKQAFANLGNNFPLKLKHVHDLSHTQVQSEITNCYGVVVPSLSDISPNFALEALSLGKPVLITEHNGLQRFDELLLQFNPFSIEEMQEKIKWLAQEENYHRIQNKIQNFSYSHSWQNIANEFLELHKK